jgi:hypothetical protein
MKALLAKLGLISKNESNNATSPVNNKRNKDNQQQQRPEDTIVMKLKKGNRQAGSMPNDELLEWARSLCIKEELIEWYLNPEFASTAEAFKKLEEAQAQIIKSNSNNTGTGLFSSTSESSHENPHQSQMEQEDLNDIDFDLDEIVKENEQPFMKLNQTVKVKLVVAEICKSDAQKAIRKMLSPILTKIDHQQQFGMFHSALVVGPWYLEWNNSSLCIPRKCYSSAAMLAADLDFGGLGFELNDTIEKISQVIIDWNVNKVYNQQNANCQQFVDELCKSLGVPIHFEGPLGEYLNNLRRRGECEIDFPVTPDMRVNLDIREAKKRFHTHQELDDFVKMLIEKEPMFQENYPMEWMLLKSFDRAFWLRHFKHQEDSKFTPDPDCPFHDPTQTASFKREWF